MQTLMVRSAKRVSNHAARLVLLILRDARKRAPQDEGCSEAGGQRRATAMPALQQPYAALPSPASRCLSRGNTSCLSSDSECSQASGLCL